MSALWAGRVLSALRAYKVCALPAAVALLLVVPYLSFSGATEGWRVKPDAGSQKGEEVFDLKCLPESPGAGADCLLNGPPLLWAKSGEALASYGSAQEWRRAVSAQGAAMWRVMSALAAVAALWAILLSGFIIQHTPRRTQGRDWYGPGGALDRFAFALLPLGLCVLLFIALNKLMAPPGGTMAMSSTRIVRQFLAHIDSQLEGGRVVYYELQLLYVGYVAALYLLCASGATLAPDARPRVETDARAEVEARAARLSTQMRHLRLILYVGAFMLALTALRGKTNFDWSLEYLPPLWALADKKPELQAATAFYAKFRGLALNNITAVGVLNTLLLAALYVPGALVLQRRAAELAGDAERAEKAEADAKAAAASAAAAAARERGLNSGAGAEEKRAEPSKPAPEKKGFDRDEWLKARGLAFPFKEQLTRVAALLSPLLAGPVSELLSMLKG